MSFEKSASIIYKFPFKAKSGSVITDADIHFLNRHDTGFRNDVVDDAGDEIPSNQMNNAEAKKPNDASYILL